MKRILKTSHLIEGVVYPKGTKVIFEQDGTYDDISTCDSCGSIIDADGLCATCGSKMTEAEVDVSGIINDLGKSFSGDNENQMKGVELLKGLSLSDDPKANEFMKKLDKATSDISAEMK